MVGYGAVRNGPPIAKSILIAFAAGILLTVVVEEIIPQAHESVETRPATLAFIVGFALFALLSIYVE
jgi:ZIP family zinc transporter